MIVVTVARKPLSEPTVASNVLVHSTGALNIDASRVGGVPSPPVERRKHAAPGVSVGATGWTTPARPPEYNQQRPGESLGRWPANLILQHRDGCRQVGTQTVKASSGIRPKDVGVTYDLHKSGSMAGAKFPVLASSYSNADGSETVDAWECLPGCPVADLDGQSGTVPTGSWVRQTDGAHPFGNAVGSPYDRWKNVAEPAGGASRFFKQVGGVRK